MNKVKLVVFAVRTRIGNPGQQNMHTDPICIEQLTPSSIVQPVEAGVAQLSLQQQGGQLPAAAEGRPMTKEEQGQFMRRKAAEKAAEMRRAEVRPSDQLRTPVGTCDVQKQPTMALHV